jgi:hypothetical protein
MAGFLGSNKSSENNFFRRIRKLNDGGWDYINKVVRKSNAIGREEYDLRKNFVGDAELDDVTPLVFDMPGVYRKHHKYESGYSTLKSEYEKDKYLEEIASYDELDFVLNTISDETIIYDDDGIFASPNISKLSTKFSLKDTVLKKIEDDYNKIYFLFRFNDNDYAWRLFKEWLIFGRIAFEIIFNENKTEIEGFKRLDPYSLNMKIQKIGKKYVKFWIQYEGDAKLERHLADDEVIYITYNDSKNRKSYLETLVRSFNLLRTLEDTRVIWGIMHSVLRMRMIVPINSKSEQRAKIKVGELRNKYKENITIDRKSGEVNINGKTDIALFKNYIFPSKDGEQIEIEPITQSFNDAISIDELEYFEKKFKRATNVPFSRFDRDNGGGTFDLSTSIENEEIMFSKFIARLRNTFKELILKPFKIQLKLSWPELLDDIQLWNTINVVFNKNNLFEEFKEMEIMEKRADFISAMSNVVVKKWSAEMEDFIEEPFFSSRYLVEKWMKLSSEEIRRNTDYKRKYGEVKPDTDDETESDSDLDF